MVYKVQRLQGPHAVDGNWDKPLWQGITPLDVASYMGTKPAHIPRVQAKLAYDDDAIYVIWRVEDRYVRAVAMKHQDMVCRDSCAEFFFAPGDDLAAGYFNLEMNCGGIMLLGFHQVPRKGSLLPVDDLAKIQIAHSLPKNVNPENAQPVTWTLEYRVPTDWLAKYCKSARKPAPGVTWRANFFKCADDCSHPHWLTWNHVRRPKPDFHVPECFGTIEFE